MARFVGDVSVDIYSGTDSDDQISGGGGNDRLYGRLGLDTINGGDGDDLLSGNGEVSSFTATMDNRDFDADRLFGGDGNDIIGGGWNDTLVGGAGYDTLYLDLRDVDRGVTLDLGRLSAGGNVRNGTGVLSGFERYAAINLTAFDDDIRLGSLGYYAVLGGGVNGGAGNDRIEASSSIFGSGSLNGGSGDDTIIGRDASDSLNGGDGADRLTAGGGNDSLYGGAGDDVIDVRGFGSDTVIGGDGTDTAILSGTRADWTTALEFRADGMFIKLNREQMQPNGASGRTVTLAEVERVRFDDVFVTAQSLLTGFVIGTDARDTLVPGQTGLYGLSPTDGNDTLYGLGGNDVLDGGLGSDTYYGGRGIDAFHLRSRGDRIMDLEDREIIYSWIDYVTPPATYASVRIELMGDRDIDATDLTATAIIGNVGDNHLTGRGVLEGGAGDDILENSGILAYADTATAVYANAASGVSVDLGIAGVQDTIGAGVDTLIRIKRLIGSDHADVLSGGDGSDTIEGGLGDDRMSGGDSPKDIGRDTVSYALATRGVTVSLALHVAQDTIGAGIDTLAGFEVLVGSAFADHLSGGTTVETLRGGAGDDQLFGGDGNDVIEGGDGADIIDGGAGHDAVSGGGGADRFVFDGSLLQRGGKDVLETIGDYRQASGDVIDLTALDADLTLAGDQAFVRVDAFTGSAGELVVRRANGDNRTTVRGDVDGDGAADFSILLYGYDISPETISFLL